jgi:hypothetical protein
MALEGGEWLAALPGQIYPRRRSPVPIVGGWVGPRAGWTQRLEEKSYVFVRHRIPVFQFVACHYTDWAARLTARCSDKLLIVQPFTSFNFFMQILKSIVITNKQTKQSVRRGRDGNAEVGHVVHALSVFIYSAVSVTGYEKVDRRPFLLRFNVYHNSSRTLIID